MTNKELIEHVKENATEMQEDGGSLYFYMPSDDDWLEVHERPEVLLAVALGIVFSVD
jgi:malate synthase